MQTRSGVIAPDAGAQLSRAVGSAGQPEFGYGGQATLTRQQPLNQDGTARQPAEQGADQETAHLRELILSLSDRLDQMSAYLTDGLVSPGDLATMPAPASAPAPAPAFAPPKRRTRPRALAARPTGPRTTTAKQPHGRPRQLQAMRVATIATAALFSVAAISGVAEIGMHGFKFFVFRSAGTGETAGSETDQQFLAKEAAAAKAAAQKGAPAKNDTAKAHTPGRHSKSTSG